MRLITIESLTVKEKQESALEIKKEIEEELKKFEQGFSYISPEKAPLRFHCKVVYGHSYFYPICENSKLFVRFKHHKKLCINKCDINLLKRLGYDIQEVSINV